MNNHTLTTIITAGRLALARAADRHPIDAAALRGVADTYARTALRYLPDHRVARALLADVTAADVKASRLRDLQDELTYLTR